MNDTCPIVTVQTVNGPVDVNASDYKPEMGVLLDPVTFEPLDGQAQMILASTDAPPAPPAPVAMLVAKKGKKFFVVDDKANPVEIVGIEAGGYDVEAEAWSAIMALNK